MNCLSELVRSLFRILHHNGFSDEEVAQKKYQIYSNVLTSMKDLLVAMDRLNIRLVDDSKEVIGWACVRPCVCTCVSQSNLQPDAGQIRETSKSDRVVEYIDPETALSIKRLWADGGVKKCFEERSKFQLIDSAD